ncbi:hypothetical protein A2J04_11165 [Rhodococcus sp. EPR-279]|nr:hypothetical protein A2J04_11165 [Rhodococcus sp. EPR-279]KZF02697.1 hypothetical protein A2J02_05060 [Rhodococcus sp. EPR-147]
MFLLITGVSLVLRAAPLHASGEASIHSVEAARGVRRDHAERHPGPEGTNGRRVAHRLPIV